MYDKMCNYATVETGVQTKIYIYTDKNTLSTIGIKNKKSKTL